MKTVSQNTPTIYSATTPENNPPQLVASLVPDEQRISFWPQHSGRVFSGRRGFFIYYTSKS